MYRWWADIHIIKIYSRAGQGGIYIIYAVVLQWYYSSGRRNPVPAIPSITLVEEKKRKNTNQKPIKKTFTYYYTIIVYASVTYSRPRVAAVRTTKTKIL